MLAAEAGIQMVGDYRFFLRLLTALFGPRSMYVMSERSGFGGGGGSTLGPCPDLGCFGLSVMFTPRFL